MLPATTTKILISLCHVYLLVNSFHFVFKILFFVKFLLCAHNVALNVVVLTLGYVHAKDSEIPLLRNSSNSYSTLNQSPL